MYKTIIADWAQLENSKKLLNIFFAYFTAINVYYSAFGKRLKSLLNIKVIDIASDQVVKIYHGQYNKLLEGPYLSFQIGTNFTEMPLK